MTYLELCQEVHRLVRTGNGDPGSEPTAVVGQTLSNLDIVTWVRQAWVEIQQSEVEWSFMIDEATATLAAGDSTIAASAIGSNYAWILPSTAGSRQAYILMFAQADGVATEFPCYHVPYRDFRGHFDRGRLEGTEDALTIARPTHCTTERNDRDLLFNARADQAYTVHFDYRVVAQELAADSDTPYNSPYAAAGILPEFHMVIVWKAVTYFCGTREDRGTLNATARGEYKRIMNRMRSRYLPKPSLNLSYQP